MHALLHRGRSREPEVFPPCQDRARLAGPIGSVLIEDIVAAQQRQIAIAILQQTAGEGVPGQGSGLRAEIWNGQGDLGPAGNTLLGSVPAAGDLLAKIRFEYLADYRTADYLPRASVKLLTGDHLHYPASGMPINSVVAARFELILGMIHSTRHERPAKGTGS